MEKTTQGYACSRCGKTVNEKIIEIQDLKNSPTAPVYTVDNTKIDYVKVNQTCPRCGNPEAFRRFLTVSGDHAGVAREKTTERFTCTSCSFSWSKK